MRGAPRLASKPPRNVFLWQGSGWTRFLRKGPEAWFTLLIETFWGKARIMEVYFNVAETGIGTYGAEAGAGVISTTAPRDLAATRPAASPRCCPFPNGARSTAQAASPAAMATPSRRGSAR